MGHGAQGPRARAIFPGGGGTSRPHSQWTREATGDWRAGGGCGGRGAAPFPWCRGSGGRSGRDFIRVPQVPGRWGRAAAVGPGERGSGRGVGERRGKGGGGGTEPKGPYGRARGLGPASPPPLPWARFIVLIPLTDAFSPRSSPLSSRLTGRSGSAAPGSRRRQWWKTSVHLQIVKGSQDLERLLYKLPGQTVVFLSSPVLKLSLLRSCPALPQLPACCKEREAQTTLQLFLSLEQTSSDQWENLQSSEGLLLTEWAAGRCGCGKCTGHFSRGPVPAWTTQGRGCWPLLGHWCLPEGLL
ncbi:collagen alpha-1(III) chain-like [Pyrgilauda ruficollis]|uniref:collagen alpha-1(III) chain-like n=1 Tax=Pyrgilauda ruficollis TaxID=221976 RepID=UPI001B87BC9F|nr:collagen alpha-1(III) chain-like [Pyrgilauda ruficollis]